LAGVTELRSASRTENRTILCVVDDAQAAAAITMIESVIGGFNAPGAGIAFTIPVGRVVGLRPPEAS
jgi:hypothetical protein